ncbi:MAG: hypothetical protein ACYTGC_12625, partial [Planctomycetota bacterium]
MKTRRSRFLLRAGAAAMAATIAMMGESVTATSLGSNGELDLQGPGLNMAIGGVGLGVDDKAKATIRGGTNGGVAGIDARTLSVQVDGPIRSAVL